MYLCTTRPCAIETLGGVMMLKVAKLGIAIAAVVAMIVPAAFAGVPSTTNSFYVPEAISQLTGLVVDGTGNGGSFTGAGGPNNAIFYMKTCPNNHGTGASAQLGFLSNNARIRVVVRDSQPAGGQPISGIAAGDVCVLLNGGTTAQGFSGSGADELIANNSLPSTNGTLGNPLCPNVRCIQADGPTDATGTTFITLTGSTPGSPGVGTRDPNRKWGHFDSITPVFVLGFPISGRLSQGSANGSYTLGIRNVDHAGGLTLVPADIAEAVNAADYNNFNANPGTFGNDFDGDGFKSAADGNVIVGHLGHDCDTPVNP